MGVPTLYIIGIDASIVAYRAAKGKGESAGRKRKRKKSKIRG
jgi:hypothetical protein